MGGNARVGNESHPSQSVTLIRIRFKGGMPTPLKYNYNLFTTVPIAYNSKT